MKKIAAVILGAGKGTRMNEGQSSPIPKVMFQVLGAPIIHYSLSNVRSAGIDDVTVVVGYKRELVEEYLGSEVEYAVQTEQLGTGHAVAVAKDQLKDRFDAILVCYGDMPLFRPETIENLVATFQQERPSIALISVDFDDPKSWAYGRIIRDEKGDVEKIIEQKDCSAAESEIKESNAGFYIFDAKWLWDNIERLESNNAQQEYYLTDMVAFAREQGRRVMAVKVNHEYEALGINTLGQLSKVEEILGKETTRS